MASAEELAALGIHLGDEAEPSQSELFYDDAEASVLDEHGDAHHAEHGHEHNNNNNNNHHDEEELFYEESLLEVDDGHHHEAPGSPAPDVSSPAADTGATATDVDKVEKPAEKVETPSSKRVADAWEAHASTADALLAKVQHMIKTQVEPPPSEDQAVPTVVDSSTQPTGQQQENTSALVQSNPHMDAAGLVSSARRMSAGPSLEDELAQLSKEAHFSESDEEKDEEKHVEAEEQDRISDAVSNPSTTVASKGAHNSDSEHSDVDESMVRLMTNVPTLPKPEKKRRQSVDTGVGPDPPTPAHAHVITARAPHLQEFQPPAPLEVDHGELIMFSDNDKQGVPLSDRGRRCCGTEDQANDQCVLL